MALAQEFGVNPHPKRGGSLSSQKVDYSRLSCAQPFTISRRDLVQNMLDPRIASLTEFLCASR
jgi:hypothetical protein